MKKGSLIVLISMLILVMVSLTGCIGVQQVPSKREVMEFVDELCPNEEVEYTVSKGKGKYYNEKQVIYSYSSLERDLDFAVIATVEPDGYIKGIWYPRIKETYRNNIRIFYKDELEPIFTKYDATFDIGKIPLGSAFDEDFDYKLAREFMVSIDSYDEMLELVELCHELNMVYSQETQYNSQSWMDENPLFSIHVNIRNVTGNYYINEFIYINGNTDYEETYNELTHIYIQHVFDGDIIDDTGFDYSDLHKSELAILVDGKPVERDDINGETSVNTWKPESFVAKYDYSTSTYYMPINPRINKDTNPELLEFYLECADGKLNDYSKLETEFKVGSHKYVINIEIIKNDINGYIDYFTIEKDGSDMNISVQDRERDGQYVFWVSLEDMAEIFNFSYTIDEDNCVIDLQFN